jgi:1,4-alpha-glucan branching enzyme
MQRARSSAGRKRVTFSIQGQPDQEVYVAGDFNAWNPTTKKMKYKNGMHSLTVMLAPGRYEYKFIIDGCWCIDPDCTEWTTNNVGSLNSVKTV